MDTRKRRLAYRAAPAALLLAATVAALGFGEAAVRLYEASGSCRYARPSPPGLWTQGPRYAGLTPGYRGKLEWGWCRETEVSVSTAGTRGGEVEPKQPGVHRILVTGDSYAFGFGVEREEAAPAQIERVLNGAPASPEGTGRYEVINAGVPGWTSRQAVAYIEDEASSLQADEVILMTYTGNDVEDRVRLEEDAELAASGGKEAPAAGAGGGCRLLKWARDGWAEILLAAGLRRRPWQAPWFDVHLADPPERVRGGVALVIQDYARLAAIASRLGLSVRIVLIPSWEAVVNPSADALCRTYACEPDEIDLTQPDRALVQGAARAGLPWLDLTKEMTSAYREGRYDFFRSHWDARGCALAGEIIARWVASDAT